MKKYIGEGLLKIARTFRRSGSKLVKEVPTIVKGAEGAKGVIAAKKVGGLASMLWRIFEVGSTAYFVYDIWRGARGEDKAETLDDLNGADDSPFLQMILSRPVLLALTTDFADKDAVADAFTSAGIAAQAIGTETGELLSVVRFAMADYLLRAPGPNTCIYNREEIETLFKQGITDEDGDKDAVDEGLKQILDSMDIDKLSDAELKPLDFIAHFLQFDNDQDVSAQIAQGGNPRLSNSNGSTLSGGNGFQLPKSAPILIN